MKIYRDGKEYELTLSEMLNAHAEYELDCMIEDVKGLLGHKTRKVELSEDQIRKVAEEAIDNLGQNDSYFDVYWMSVEYTLDDYIDSLPVDEEEDYE
jgi:hypothetical protein